MHTFHRTRSIAVVGGLALAVPLFGSGCSPKGADVLPPPKGPFKITDYYAPSGAMGDGSTTGNLVTGTDCKERPPGARGDCWAFHYNASSPYTTVVSNSMGICNWAGVFFQYPANNWGADQGLPVPITKLTRMTAQVAVASGSEQITFQLGGIGNPQPDGAPGVSTTACPPTETPPPPNYDVINGQVVMNIGTDWQQVQVPIAPRDPSVPLPDTINLIGGFAWAVSGTIGGTLPKTIYLDDLFFE